MIFKFLLLIRIIQFNHPFINKLTMRSYSLTTDMDFRVIPSAIPLQSPSPDKRSINVITPTISPNAIQIKKGATPIKNTRIQKENNKSGYEYENEIKYHSQTAGSQNSTALKQKDDIIKNLRNIIDMITENNRYKKGSQTQQSDLKNEVKILTIQNQKLVNIIDKMSKSKPVQQTTSNISQQYEGKISQLMKTLRQNQIFHEQQTKQLKRFNKSLNNQLKNIESQKNQLQRENKKLLGILKQRNQGQNKKNQKLKLSDASQNSNEERSLNTNQNKSQQRLTLMKIRQQHSQNLKALKQGLIKEIEQTFDTMKIALDGINIKMTSLNNRLQSIEKMTWARVRKTRTQTQSITISISQGVRHEEAPITDRSYKLQKKNNSQIYIEQGPASSHQRASQDQFSRLQQVSSRSQKNLTNHMQQQLKAVKSQLHQLRFKYDKLCLDTSELGFSQRIKPEDLSGITDRYRETMKQISNKDKQINILYNQIRKMEEQNLIEHRKKDEWLRQKQVQVQKIKQIHEQQIQDIKNQTELKVKMLIQNYQKQIELLQRELMIKNASLNEASQSIFIQKSQSSRKIQDHMKKASQLEIQNRQLKLKLKQAQQNIITFRQDSDRLHKSIQQQLKMLQETSDNNRRKRQQLEQQVMLKISQISQQKIQIQALKAQLQSKIQQSEEIRKSHSSIEQTSKKQQENNKKLRELLIEKENIIIKLRQAIAEWSNSSILQQINQIKQLLQKSQSQQQLIQKQTIISEQRFKVQKLLNQIKQLRQQNQQLRTQLINKDQLTTQLQAKVNQLQSLYEMIKSKLAEQQQLYIRLMDKASEYEKQISHIRIQKQQYIAKSKNNLNSQNIIGKIEQIRSIQLQRNQYMQKLFRQGDPQKKSE